MRCALRGTDNKIIGLSCAEGGEWGRVSAYIEGTRYSPVSLILSLPLFLPFFFLFPLISISARARTADFST
jgi:hypothetical protein